MTTDIASRIPGRAITTYGLLDEATETYGISRTDAHDTIHSLLTGIIEVDGEQVILERTPLRPTLETSNPGDVDRYYWLTISDTTADEIREGLAAIYKDAE